MAIIDYLNNKKDVPTSFPHQGGHWPHFCQAGIIREVCNSCSYTAQVSFSVSVSELEGKGKEKLIRMK